MNDLRFALRQLAKSPGFTLVAILTLALGIAVNAAFTTIANDLFFRPLPASDPSQLVVIAYRSSAVPYQLPYSFPDSVDFRSFVEGRDGSVPEMARIFSGLMAYKEQVVHLSRQGHSTERTWVHAVTDNYFSVLGVQPHLGRFFLPKEVTAPGAEPVIVLGYDTWRTRFGADATVVGQAVKLNGVLFTVIGVAPPGFFGASWGTALSGFVPVTMLTRLLPGGEYYALQPGNTCAFLMARLRPDVTLAQAQAAADVALARLIQNHPGNYLPNTRAVVMREGHSRPSPYIAQHTPKIVLGLTALGFLVLVVALANTANLLYARHAAREREFAICSALGATRFRLVRRLLTESLLLATVAGMVGALASLWLVPALLAFVPISGNTAPAAVVAADWRPFVTTGLVVLAAGFFTGILPALQASGCEPAPFIRPTPPMSSRDRHRLRQLMVVGQVAVSTVVLAASAFALRSVILLSRADLGFRTSSLFLTSFDLGAQHYSPEKGRRFQATLLEKVRALPGVDAASLTTGVPLDTAINLIGGIMAAGEAAPTASAGVTAATVRVDHTYLSTLGLPVVTGRGFTAHDNAKSPAVALVNRPMANALWPGHDPVGQRILVQGHVAEVVGIVGPSRYYGLQDPNRFLLILPLAQDYRGEVTLVVHTTQSTVPLAAAIAEIVRQQDADLPLFNSRTMEQQVAQSAVGLMPFRTGALLAGFQGGVALTLAAAGIFSLIAFTVVRRTREMGIRMALGATPSAVIRTTAHESLVATVAGLVGGLLVAFVLSRVFSPLLYGGGASDFLVLALTALVIAVAVVLACWLPARRATRVNPVEALRAE